MDVRNARARDGRGGLQSEEHEKGIRSTARAANFRSFTLPLHSNGGRKAFNRSETQDRSQAAGKAVHFRSSAGLVPRHLILRRGEVAYDLVFLDLVHNDLIRLFGLESIELNRLIDGA